MGRVSEAIKQKTGGASARGRGVSCGGTRGTVQAGEGAALIKPTEVPGEILLLQLVTFNC